VLQASRYTLLTDWLSAVLASDQASIVGQLTPMTGDAGFRQYYRFTYQGQSLIAVDAPPQHSNNVAFIAVGQALLNENIKVPTIIACDLPRGFFCLSDFGDQLLADALVEQTSAQAITKSYHQAITLLPAIARATMVNNHGSIAQTMVQPYSLPLYDQGFIERELALFTQWLLAKHLNIVLTLDQKIELEACFAFLTTSILSQPTITTHRDFHSRNIMVLADGSLGIIDFQDAVIGPITYDIVSLLRDCYRRLPEHITEPLFQSFCHLMTEQYALQHISDQQWRQWFDLMGVQRHLKASGIFCRLFYRDHKSTYLNDIPLTLSYVKDISANYPALSFLHQLLTAQVIPALQARPTTPSERK